MTHVQVALVVALVASVVGCGGSPQVAGADDERRSEYEAVLKSLEADAKLPSEEKERKRARLEMDYGEVMEKK